MRPQRSDAAIDLLPYANGLIKALERAGGTHSLADVVEELAEGTAQLWQRGSSCIITHIRQCPQKKVLVYWLATGRRDELFEMVPLINSWAKSVAQCDQAMFIGRTGWARTTLMDDGWRQVSAHYLKEL